MSVVRKFYPEVRLRRMFNAPDGLRASDAIERAAEKLEEIRDKCLTAIDDKLCRLSDLSNDVELNRSICYTLSNEIFAEAGTFGLNEMSDVAHSLCTLLTAPESVPKAVLNVHLDALRALRRPAIAGNKMLRAAVLNELRGLSAKIATERGNE